MMNEEKQRRKELVRQHDLKERLREEQKRREISRRMKRSIEELRVMRVEWELRDANRKTLTKDKESID